MTNQPLPSNGTKIEIARSLYKALAAPSLPLLEAVDASEVDMRLGQRIEVVSHPFPSPTHF